MGRLNLLAFLAPTILFHCFAYASLFTSPSQVLLDKTYDYIVIGGGAGGGVIANRLSEDTSLSVLLIEAGSSDFGNINITVPRFASRLSNSRFDWNFTTVNQSGLNNRAIPYTRGFVLGGSTAVNFMTYTRGSQDDYDRWAIVTNDEGWSWESLEPYMRKLEALVPPIDEHDTTGQVDPSVHGFSGPLKISLPGAPQATDDLVISTSSQLPVEFPFNLDYNAGNTIGIGWSQSTIANGERVSSAVAYIGPALSRRNLNVLVNTRVTRVLQTGARSSIPTFRGVEFAESPGGIVHTLHATKEVILCAGAVNTPQILMLSGIGDAGYLSSLSIDPVVNLPDVGNNLQDHTLVTASFTVNSSDTIDRLTEDPEFFDSQLALWFKNRSGIFGAPTSSQKGWLRLPDDSSIFDTIPDPSAGPTSGHYELLFTNGFLSFSEPLPLEGGHFFTVAVALVSPTSRGNISLASLNPFDPPIINPNLLGTDFDIFTMREAIKAVRRFVSAPAWDGWILEEFGAFSQAHTDEEIEDFIRSTAVTVDHVSGTVAMGKTGTGGPGAGALNSDLTVKGTIGLRVVDASVFPFIIATHTQAAVYTVAERAAGLIKHTLKANY